MTDTQWPRYEVFKQDKPNRPHEAIGTVHAPDNEIALQNARDVHVRRPDCHSLWVAPEAAILKMTAQQLANQPLSADAHEDADEDLSRYQIFAKQTLRRSMAAATHVGEIAAVSPANALAMAMNNETWNSSEIYVWWIVPESAITRNEPDDILAMFEPATRKTYKQQSRYGLVERTAERTVQATPADSPDRQPTQ